MRTTQNIANDILFSTSKIARRETVALRQTNGELAPHHDSERLIQYGIVPLPLRGKIVNNALINQLGDDAGV